MEGWFKFERKWLENGVINRDNDHLVIYVHLCAKAAFEPLQTTFGKQPIVLQPGQLVTGRRKIANECRIAESKVTRVLALFEKAEIIRQETHTTCRLITICAPAFDPQANRARTAGEPQVNHRRTTGEPQVNTNKEWKNEKNERAKKTRAGARKPPEDPNSFFSSAPAYDLSAFFENAIGLRPSDREAGSP